MRVTYHRVLTLSPLRLVAAAIVALLLAGIAMLVLALATTVAVGAYLARAARSLVSVRRRAEPQHPSTIEGELVDVDSRASSRLQ